MKLRHFLSYLVFAFNFAIAHAQSGIVDEKWVNKQIIPQNIENVAVLNLRQEFRIADLVYFHRARNGSFSEYSNVHISIDASKFDRIGKNRSSKRIIGSNVSYDNHGYGDFTSFTLPNSFPGIIESYSRSSTQPSILRSQVYTLLKVSR